MQMQNVTDDEWSVMMYVITMRSKKNDARGVSSLL